MKKNDRIKPFVIHCMIMRLSEKESLEYLTKKGFDIKHRRFYAIKKEIEDSRFERLSKIAKEGFVDQHLERLSQLELINEEMWKNYRARDFEAMNAIMKIAEIQPYLSIFYDASKDVMESSIKDQEQDTISISQSPEE
jgi:hypothetical protein